RAINMQHEVLNQEFFDGWPPEDRSLLVDYALHLAERGYGYRTQRGYVGVVAHWLRWRTTRSQPWNLDWHGIRQFLDEHLPTCQCPDSGDKGFKTVRAALNQLLIMHGYERIRSTD